MTESRIEKLTRIGQEMAAAVDEMRAEAVDLTPGLTTKLAIRQIEGETAWWRSVGHDRSARRTFDSMTGDSQQAVRTGVERVLAHLQSACRLIPAGGMALTAEQVEDVEALVATANPYSAPAVRLRALFPVTEPAEPAASEGVNCGANSVVLGWCTLSAQHEGLHTNGTYFWGQAPAPAEPADGSVGDPLQAGKEFLKPKPIGWYRTMTPQFATEHFGFPGVIGSKGFWTHTASDGGKWAWDGDDWELREYPPAPAEPAEEETKAEGRRPLLTPNQIRDANPGKHETFIFGQQHADGTACVGCSWQTYKVLDSKHAVAEHDDSKGLPHDHSVWITKDGMCPCGQPASSPVAPAPTETGPWETWQEVPEGVQYYGINGWGPTYYVNRGGVRYRVFDDTPSKTADYVVQNFAPFVAAKEG